MNITLQLKRGNPRGDREEVGDVINIWRTGEKGLTAPGKYLYIHITNVPDMPRAKTRRMLQMFTAFDYEPDGTIDPKTGEPNLRLRNSRLWHVPLGALPRARRRALRRDGEITVKWGWVRPYLRRKLAKIDRDDTVNKTNYDETKSTPLTDAEIAGA